MLKGALYEWNVKPFLWSMQHQQAFDVEKDVSPLLHAWHTTTSKHW